MDTNYSNLEIKEEGSKLPWPNEDVACRQKEKIRSHSQTESTAQDQKEHDIIWHRNFQRGKETTGHQTAKKKKNVLRQFLRPHKETRQNSPPLTCT